MPASDQILTVGHSNHEEPRFLELLRGAGVALLADVRANPRSRYPQFNRSSLAGSLGAVGIGYAQLGAELGGRRQPATDSTNSGWDPEWFQGYADHMASPEFSAGTARLEQLAASALSAATNTAAGLTAIMCAEADWRACHRRLIADALTVRGWRVLHLAPDGSLTQHELTDFAVVEDGRITYPAPQTSLGL